MLVIEKALQTLVKGHRLDAAALEGGLFCCVGVHAFPFFLVGALKKQNQKERAVSQSCRFLSFFVLLVLLALVVVCVKSRGLRGCG